MVLNISSYFSLGKKGPIGRPMLNEIPVQSTDGSLINTSTILRQKSQFFRWFKTRPELNSPVSIRVDDTITEVDFFKPDGTPLGPTQKRKAQMFYDSNMMDDRLKSVQFDRLVTGSGFLWKGYVDTKGHNLLRLREVCEKYAKVICSGLKIKQTDSLTNSLMLKTIDEDLRKPRKIDYVASSTLSIDHDAYDIIKYVQRFAGKEEIFLPNEIVHLPLARIDGKVDGFTPLQSLGYELTLLWAIKENMLSFVRNGGTMGKIFVLPEEMHNSENFLWLSQQLQNIGVIQNRHGNLALTGRVEVIDVEKNVREMEYKELALYITSNIAYALRVPVTRIPYLIGSASSSSDGGGMAESGYWSMIESDQRIIERTVNSQIFTKLGFSVRFKKQYKINDLREAQALNMRIDAVTKIQGELRKTGLKMTKDKMIFLMDLASNEVQDIPKDEMLSGFEKTGLLNRNMVKNNQVEKEPDKLQKDETKKTAAINNPKSNLQTGY